MEGGRPWGSWKIIRSVDASGEGITKGRMLNNQLMDQIKEFINVVKVVAEEEGFRTILTED